MSEFSESYHIRTDDPEAVLDRLDKAGFAGFAFPPKNGWLSFVPFPTCKPLVKGDPAGPALTEAAQATVLEYQYAEDHGWMFTLYRPGHALSRLEQAWDPEPAADESALDIDSVIELTRDAVTAAELRALLSATPGRAVALQFAETLGLPAYRWISPSYAQGDPKSFLAQGAKRLGPAPHDPLDGIVCPPNQSHAFARPDLTAREAMDLANACMAKTHAGWIAVEIHCQGGGAIANMDGRLEPGGQWHIKYRPAEGPTVITAVLSRDSDKIIFIPSRIDFMGNSPIPEAHVDARPPQALPGDLVDSPEVMAALNPETPDDLGPPAACLLLARQPRQGTMAWEVHRRWGPLPDMAQMVQSVDLRTGRLLTTAFQRRNTDGTVEQWRR